MERAVIKSAGSSPHTRGARHPFRNARRQLRIIPAYAGSTTTLRRPSRISWDHPRIRGEHDCSIYFTNFPTGSSPHTRGAQGDRRHPCAWVGIIPAYAGSTWAGCLVQGVSWDHPRIRGEHVGWAWEGVKLVGSSPHTRGAHAREHQTRRVHGIIPAYAGSTSGASDDGRPVRDHPRIRGEHIVGSIGMVIGWGSSPHTRGAHRRQHWDGYRLGIIPAYAGSTSSAALGWLSVGDHPRIRGEHIKSGFGAIKDGGSSPHTRGAQCRGWRS